MPRFRTLLAAIALLICSSLPSGAEEAIRRFISDVTINLDSSILVTETITFEVEGKAIKRGILRDIPTIYQSPDGSRYEVGLLVNKVLRDGQEEPWSTESLANGIRIRIGQADVLLDHGLHTYEITYEARRELGFFEGYDELYWNVTGNAWTFAIDRAEAVIRLPSGASIIQHAAYTGPQGAKGQDFQIVRGTGSVYEAVTTRRLEPGEGFTVAVGFTKGVVTPPLPPPDTTVTSYKVLGGGTVLLFAYYLLSWFRVGRDPAGRPIIPLFHPPQGLGPAGARFIWKRVYDKTSFAAAVIGLAAKGAVSIKGNGTYQLTKLKADTKAMAPSELALYRQMPQALTVKRDTGATLGGMWSSLDQHIRNELNTTTFRKNRMWFAAGIVLSFLVLAASLMFVRPQEFSVALIVVYAGGAAWALVLWLLMVWWRMFRNPGFMAKVGAVLCFIATLPIVFFALFVPTTMAGDVWGPTLWIYLAALLALAIMHIVFFRLLTAQTELGRRLFDEVEGLRLYLATAEEERLNMLNPPEKTPALFERLLPYAVALDCENAWSAKFAQVLAAAAYTGPAWYQGRNWSAMEAGRFTDTLDNNRYGPSTSSSGSSFSTSSSNSSPGSFSGSSGGGSSGGGGGGGGGSGW